MFPNRLSRNATIFWLYTQAHQEIRKVKHFTTYLKSRCTKASLILKLWTVWTSIKSMLIWTAHNMWIEQHRISRCLLYSDHLYGRSPPPKDARTDQMCERSVLPVDRVDMALFIKPLQTSKKGGVKKIYLNLTALPCHLGLGYNHRLPMSPLLQTRRD